MPNIVKELSKGQKYIIGVDQTDAVKSFSVEGATDPVDAISSPDIPVRGERYTYDSQPSGVLSTLLASNISCVNAEKRDDLHIVTVLYTNKPSAFKPSDPKDGDEIWTFQPTGAVVNVSDAYTQIKFGGVADESKDFGVLIGVDDSNGTIQGAVIPDTSEILLVDYWINAQLVTDAFLADTRSEKNFTNSTVWYGAAIGSCRYDGMTIIQNGADISQLQFKFTISDNKIEAELPTYKNKAGQSYTIVGGKKGWQYLWTDTKTQVDAGVSLPYTKGVYIADVFQPSDFSKLPISGLIRPDAVWPPLWF